MYDVTCSWLVLFILFCSVMFLSCSCAVGTAQGFFSVLTAAGNVAPVVVGAFAGTHTLQYSTVLNFLALYCTVLYCTVQYCSVLYMLISCVRVGICICVCFITVLSQTAP